MKVINFPNKIKEQNSTIILGGFSMFHIGHIELINAAKKFNNKIILFMFDKPELLPNKTKEIFEQLEVRLQKAANLGIDYVIVIKAVKENIFLEANDFVDILKGYNPSRIMCGPDYRFGHNAKGNVELLQKSFTVNALEHIKVSNKKISASIIKEQIPFGEIAFCNSLMSEPWTIKVTIGAKKSFKINEQQIQPHNGIYAITMELNNMLYHGVASVHDGKTTLKLLNYKNNLQNQEVYIRFIQELKISIKYGDNKIEQQHLDQANTLFKNMLKK